MTNAEKYLKDGIDIMQMLHDYNQTGQKCPSVWKWLEQEVKPTLTEDERVILRNMKNSDGNYETIERDREGDLCISNVNFAKYITMYNHLFQFIKERKRI